LLFQIRFFKVGGVNLNISKIIETTNQFIDKLETPDGFKLFERSEISPFARCFVIFNKSLTKQYNWLEERKQFLIKDLNIDLHILYKEKVENKIEWRDDKSFLQLFCFTLSSLNILNGKLTDQNLEILKKILDTDFKKNLEKKGVHRGTAKSGNHSMFFAIFNIYANNYLNIDRTKQIKDWLEFNSNTINSNGFWGKKVYMDYLQFQNGYHQYEIFEYLEFNKVSWNNAARKTLLMSDKLGHFAPWPGGGACYDYDAIFMLTSKFVNDFGQQNVLKKTLNSIIDEQNDDGGFCESKYLRRNVLIKFINMINHIIFQPKHVKLRSILINLNLLRYKNRNIITYWTPTDRRWDESNAWDTFFRLSTIFRICNRLNLDEKNLFKINKFPGIG
tara:strand:- start:40539 stop:41705 length:1167 start_codon:yes stop_codon:yes gene_type:complete